MLAPACPITSFALLPRDRTELFERLRSANDRTKRRGAEQIVPNFMAAGRSRRGSEIATGASSRSVKLGPVASGRSSALQVRNSYRN